MTPEDPHFSARSRAVQIERNVESVVLADVVEQLPRLPTLSELVANLSAPIKDSAKADRAAEVSKAVDGLVAVGILRWDENHLAPTAAGRRAAELEIGL